MLRSSSNEFFAPEERSRKSNRKGHKALQELTINKLNYQSIGLVGREQEVDTLRSCLYRAAETPSEEKQVKKEFVGKFKIAETANTYAKEIGNGTVVQSNRFILQSLTN